MCLGPSLSLTFPTPSLFLVLPVFNCFLINYLSSEKQRPTYIMWLRSLSLEERENKVDRLNDGKIMSICCDDHSPTLSGIGIFSVQLAQLAPQDPGTGLVLTQFWASILGLLTYSSPHWNARFFLRRGVQQRLTCGLLRGTMCSSCLRTFL